MYDKVQRALVTAYQMILHGAHLEYHLSHTLLVGSGLVVKYQDWVWRLISLWNEEVCDSLVPQSPYVCTLKFYPNI